MSFRNKVIWELYPETHSISDEPVGVLDKNNNKIKLDESAIAIKEAELQAEYDAQAYSRKREAEYPSIQECIHAILDDDLTALQEKRQAVKTKYPKS